MGCFSACMKKPTGARPTGTIGSRQRSIRSTIDTGVPKYEDVYTTGKKLGQGAFSVVKEAVRNDTHDLYAVKIVSKRGLAKEDAAGLEQEIRILQELDHPNVVQLMDLFAAPLRIYIVLEYMTGGELFDRIVQKECYNEQESRDVCQTLFTAIKYCHDRRVAHRDLKPENLLLLSREDDKKIKIADFGFAKKCIGMHSLTTQCGTPGYVAPEILHGNPYGTQVDMWGLGVIMYILLVGYPPFNGKNQNELFTLIKKGKYIFHEEFWGDVSTDAKDLIKHLITVDPNERYTADQALESTWMLSKKETLGARNLDKTLLQFRKFNAKRKLKQAVLATIATAKMNHFIGLGVDQTFAFNQVQSKITGCGRIMKSSESLEGNEH